ncbi:hypothetical protein [Thalassotalea profundi]|uniref:DUF2842 domain-containing protein n=1 Tax=Thalassotalea profundi TaxID=2036687 RepID=A0ABQ3IE78_9GAMM|nr:hypothetical protein [Thalassotalea profundi]GHE80313.1 hypothetical protein GCM10011501_05230 [Thalassotalea profundi]
MSVYTRIKAIMLLLSIVSIALIFSAFFYCQALSNGLGRKRWAVAGLCFGPLIWPMFCMKKRMKLNRLFGLNYSLLRA